MQVVQPGDKICNYYKLHHLMGKLSSYAWVRCASAGNVLVLPWQGFEEFEAPLAQMTVPCLNNIPNKRFKTKIIFRCTLTLTAQYAFSKVLILEIEIYRVYIYPM